MRLRIVLSVPLVFLSAWSHAHGGDGKPAAKKIVLLAGDLDKGHPPGTHEYVKSVQLLARCLEGVKGVAVETHLHGWPAKETTLDDAATIVLLSNGADRNPRDHPFLVGDRLKVIERQMKRGCGLVVMHWGLFVPEKNSEQFLDWIGGYFDYENGPKAGGRSWYSKIHTAVSTSRPGSPRHPVCRGVEPFELREEYYYNIRFRPDDARRVPLLTAEIPGEKGPQVVAWGVERKDGGRGFGFTGGHFFDNWKVDGFRRLVLNAVLWTAGVEVPAGGVQAPFPDDAAPIKALIVTGHQHPAHKWQDTTPALEEALRADPRFRIQVAKDPEFLASKALHGFDVVVMNYCNWQRPGLSDAAKANFVKYLQGGGGLAIVHFANGAFHFSLPGGAASDWPEWRTKICRRVWDHTKGKSGHDPYGPFEVRISADHAITRGLKPYLTTDELYYRQQGKEPIEVLATARSRVTGKDEPMAMVYRYGKARVFQTVLGHDAASLRVAGTAALIRRGSAWAAGREPPAEPAPAPPVPRESLAPGRFGSALDARVASAEVAGRPEYQRPPFTVECWARVFSKERFNVLVSKNLKASAEHWEIYTYAGSGEFSAYFPGFTPGEVKSGVPITDGLWHFLAMTFDGKTAELFIDGKRVKTAALKRVRSGGPDSALWLGKYPEFGLGCDGLLDEVRISRGVRAIDAVPAVPLPADADTVGLWRFDATDLKRLKDDSRLDNAAVLRQPGRVAEAAPPQVEYRTADPELRIVKIDHSPDESFLSLRLDSAGRLFVGCREAVFAYEPDAQGGYGARRLLYRFPPDTWVNDVEIRGDDLYCMTNAALYVLPGGRVRREGLKPRRLLWGSPVDMHVTYHGLAWGPEGDLYFSSGDPLLTYGDFEKRPDHWGHWTVYTQPEGTRVPFTGVGGFYRCRPDGSGFRVVAQGTRGSFGVAFDRGWDLFSNDNDHESIPSRYVPGRLLHVAPRAHFFWPRGWMAEKTPERADLLETVFAGMGRAVPVGQAYCDEPFLPERYRNNLLVARWCQKRVTRYPLSLRGASFKAEEHTLLECGGIGRPVGVAVGRGGRIFVAVSHMAANAYSPHYPSDLLMITRKDDPPTHPFEPYESVSVRAERLWQELSSPSLRQRQHAHQEILRRGGSLLAEAVRRLEQCKPDDPALNHLPWLAAASGRTDAAALLARRARDLRAEVRLQAVRALAEFPALKAPCELFVGAVRDADAHVRHAALVALSDGPVPDAVLRGPARSADTYLRQAAAFLLAERGTLRQIEELCDAADAPGRLAGILAAGFRLTVPPTGSEPPKGLRLTVRRAGHIWDAKTVIRYADATVDLEKLGRIGSYTTAEAWALGKHSATEKALFELLLERLADPAEANRLQAAYFLSLLNDPRSEPLVVRVRAAAVSQRLAAAPLQKVGKAWVVGPFPDGAQGKPHPSEAGAIDLSAQYEAGGRRLGWSVVAATDRFDLRRAPGWDGPATFYLYYRLQSLHPAKAELLAGTFDAVALWVNGSPVPPGKAALDLQPGSNDVLVRVRGADGRATVALQFRATGRVEAALPERLGLGTLAERLKTAAGKEVDLRKFLAIDWPKAAAGGDAERGRKLFGADGLGCVKCHGILPGQNGGGAPNLADAGKRFTVAHLVESILLPSKQVAPLFRATYVETKAGVALTGLVVAEDGKEVVLLLPDATRRAIPRGEIEVRRVLEVSPMPAGVVRTPEELRDLLAYLLGPNPKVP